MYATLFFVFTYAIGACSSFIVPLVSTHAGDHAQAVFSVYFTGVVAGQLAVYKFRILTEARGVELFTRTLLLVSFVLMATLPTPWGFIVGRGIEGIGGGMLIPLLFRDALRLPGRASHERNVALMNSFYAIGYATGPILGRVLVPAFGAVPALLSFGLVVFALSAAIEALRPARREAPAGDPPPKIVGARDEWFKRFYLLFLEKAFYGYVITLLAANQGLPGVAAPLWLLLLALSFIFVVGQLIAARAVASLPERLLTSYVPAGMGASLLVFHAVPTAVTLGLSAFLHSILLFIGVRVSGIKPADTRSYAIYNCLSDPGLILGAALSDQGTYGVLAIVLACLVPLVTFVAEPSSG